jgi:cytochrome c-type biogenesis protein CcmE
MLVIGGRFMAESTTPQANPVSRTKFFVGGFLIVAAVVYLIASSTQANAQYFLTVNEVYTKGEDILARDLRLSGAVVGDTIEYDPDTLTLTFEIAHIPGDNDEIDAQGGLGVVLNKAVTDPDSMRLNVVYVGPKPDLLQNEAQAIMTGRLDNDGTFFADELLLKCPTKYEDAVPEQAEG